MKPEETIERATKVMHAEVCCPCDPQGCNWEHTREARGAWALADAGLLARPLPSREEIADVILAESLFGHRTPIAASDAVLALLKGQQQ